MNVSYTPAPCKGKGADFSGEVVLRVPTYEERMEMGVDSRFLELAERDQGEVKNNTEYLKAMIALVKASYEHYVKVDITRSKDKKHFKDVDSLKYDPSCASILQDVAVKLVSGLELGN